MERTCSLSEAFWQEEDAVGVIEIILILVVLIGLALGAFALARKKRRA